MIIVSLLSLIYDVQFWFIKALDFPRVQVLVVLLICLSLFAVLNKRWTLMPYLFLAGLVASIVLQARFILPYTPLANKAVESADPLSINQEKAFSLLIANVWIKNKRVEALLDIVNESDPDVVLVLETNKWWINQLAVLQKQFPHSVKYPLDNTYGIALYSKLPLENTEIKFLNQDKVPSIHTTVKLLDGSSFMLHAVHPVPPKPSEHPDNVGEKEVALLKVGKMVAQRELPTVVAGDLNDVAWSKTSRLFGTSSRLGDVRVGRGLYNSFDATSLIFRWPLDHVYVSQEFKVLELDRKSAFGSDHFPIFVKLYLHE
ncbi:endonuclease/exonuclease/phosphatase family protein [Pontibacter aquaedesilientis]|nr:endonuclease/exonuclease/phosphatase family protein [Pontibacter aquaedesilientis]